MSTVKEPALASLSKSIKSLTDFNNSIKGESSIDKADVLARKLGVFSSSLQEVHRAGTLMDESMLLEIPLDMLAFLEEEVSNPDLYKYKALEDLESYASKINKRMATLHSAAHQISTATGVMPRKASDVQQDFIKIHEQLEQLRGKTTEGPCSGGGESANATKE